MFTKGDAEGASSPPQCFFVGNKDEWSEWVRMGSGEGATQTEQTMGISPSFPRMDVRKFTEGKVAGRAEIERRGN